MTVMMMNDNVDDEIEDSGNHYHNKMGLEYNSQKPFPQQNGFGVQLTETISTENGFGIPVR